MRPSTLKDHYLNATVWLNDKLVMDNGKIIDKLWWEDKVNKCKLIHESGIKGLGLCH